MVQLKDFFLKLWFHLLEVVSLSRIHGLAFFPNSWSPGPFAYQDYEYIKYYKCALAGRCQCWRGKLTMSSVDYHSKSLLLEEWGMLGLCHHRGFHILCKEATFWPLKNFSQWKLDSNMNFSYQDFKKVQTVHHLWRWGDCRVIYLCEIKHVSQLVFFSICAILN